MAHAHICELICILCVHGDQRGRQAPSVSLSTVFLEMGPVTEPGARLVAGRKLRWSSLLPVLSTTLRHREPWPCLSFPCCWGFELRSVSLHSSLLWRRHGLLFLSFRQHPCLLSPCAATFQAASAEALIFPSVLSTAPIHEKTPKHMPGHLLSRPSCFVSGCH